MKLYGVDIASDDDDDYKPSIHDDEQSAEIKVKPKLDVNEFFNSMK